jgi:hypothetical protein
MADAADLYNRIVWRTVKVWRRIASLQEYMRCESPTAREELSSAAKRLLSEVLSSPNYHTPEQVEAVAQMIPNYAAAVMSGIIKDAVATADAACTVLAHSMLDAAVDDYCEVSSILCPTDWEEDVAHDKITLAQARDPGGIDEQMKKAISKYISRLRNRSLANKIAVLQAVCKPGSSEILKDYSYDRQRIARFDSFRHRIVHEGALGSSIDDSKNVSADLEFIGRTSIYLANLISHRYGLVVGPDITNELLSD